MKRIQLTLLIGILTIAVTYAQQTEKAYRKYARCIDQNNPKKIEQLVAKGLDINARDSEGKTPLLYSLQENKPNFSTLLIDAGADIYLTDNKGNTCLHYAIENCTESYIINILIEKGEPIDAPNFEGYSPLYFAILFKCPELPFYFIHKAADYGRITVFNENALHLSVESGCDSLSHFLLTQGIEFDRKDNDGNTPLLKAFIFYRPEMEKTLIEQGAGINAVNADGTGALQFAVENNDSAGVTLLIEHEVNLPDSTEPLIYRAAYSENEAIVKQLLQCGIENPMKCDTKDNCYLSAFISYTNAKMVGDSMQTVLLEKSLEMYNNARDGYKKELAKIRAGNTLKFTGEILGAAAAGVTQTSYVPIGFDYHVDRKEELKMLIGKCEARIEEIEKILEKN
jgi:ankyrin repeat protein